MFTSIQCIIDLIITIVLNWIRLPSRQLQTFVGNRVSQIQSFSKSSQWHHVSTHENLADLLSRGIFPIEPMNSSLWWSETDWLLSDKTDWPSKAAQTQVEVPEVKVSIQWHTAIKKQELFPFIRFSSFNKLNRSFAYMLRFIYNCRNKDTERKIILDCLELKAATLKLASLAQREHCPDIFKRSLESNVISTPKRKLIKLSPFIDDHGLLRVGGRIVNSNFDYDKRHPIILPPKHHLSLLIMRHEHLKLMQAGPQLLPSSL